MDQATHFYAKDRAAWWGWLQDNYLTQASVWLVYDKGDARKLSYDDIVEVALCFGWVDSRPGKVSDTQTKIYVSKRKPKSVWSKSNKVRAEQLAKHGLMQPAGIAAVKIAKANGAWDALNKSDRFIKPKEMTDLLKKNKTAADYYENFSNSSKRVILEWIYAAKQEQTKMKRIQETVALAEQGIKANHYRQ
jgi:uncharacterized protein YdeI (YjbR/CyaY-like superfamily)